MSAIDVELPPHPPPRQPEVFEWGQGVLRFMEALATKQNADGARADALKTQQAIVVFAEWLDDLDDDYLHDLAALFSGEP